MTQAKLLTLKPVRSLANLFSYGKHLLDQILNSQESPVALLNPAVFNWLDEVTTLKNPEEFLA